MRVNDRLNNKYCERELSTCRNCVKASEGIGCPDQEEKETNAL